MIRNLRACTGYTMVEAVVVLAIVGILALAGVSMLGDRSSASVRSILDDLEGTIVSAQGNVRISAADGYLCSAGDWSSGTLILDGRALKPGITVPDAPGVSTNRLGSDSDCFRVDPKSGDHVRAGIATAANNWWATALAGGVDLVNTPPVSTSDLKAALGNNLFDSAGNIRINGITGRFEQGFAVYVVSLSNGQPVPKAPVGVIVVPNNGMTVYKFIHKNGAWRKL